jgi:hypothetical protein
MSLQGNIITASDVGRRTRAGMFRLISTYYENMHWDKFISDLEEKEWVLLLKDNKGTVKGFTTLMVRDFTVDNVQAKCFFSGDTIVDCDCRGSYLFHKVWIDFVLETSRKYPDSKSYWLMISKGYKTYRFLPLYFKSFYPTFTKPTPVFEKHLMDTFGRCKFPDRYNGRAGIIYNRGTCDYLKQGVADLSPARLRDPHVRFFVRANPEYYRGDELVCLADLDMANFKPAINLLLR